MGIIAGSGAGACPPGIGRVARAGVARLVDRLRRRREERAAIRALETLLAADRRVLSDVRLERADVAAEIAAVRKGLRR